MFLDSIEAPDTRKYTHRNWSGSQGVGDCYTDPQIAKASYTSSLRSRALVVEIGVDRRE
jgi:hypothetical protein